MISPQDTGSGVGNWIPNMSWYLRIRFFSFKKFVRSREEGLQVGTTQSTGPPVSERPTWSLGQSLVRRGQPTPLVTDRSAPMKNCSPYDQTEINRVPGILICKVDPVPVHPSTLGFFVPSLSLRECSTDLTGREWRRRLVEGLGVPDPVHRVYTRGNRVSPLSLTPWESTVTASCTDRGNRTGPPRVRTDVCFHHSSRNVFGTTSLRGLGNRSISV